MMHRKAVRHRSDNFIKLGSSEPLAPVTEDVVLSPSRVLMPFEGVETWAKDRRYLVAPAVLKMCPLHILNLFSNHTSNPSLPSNVVVDEEQTESSPFQTILLGKAMVAILAAQKYTDETYGW
eukprot:CAMPEP_0197827138 /NCGR_PEP_ID=MMETSP1437-20131217/3991_1 /TAXON_ID=49252 ORGANISM="Eucampia antarctica, Strain CCMP1452" /NCGR_SAMPLE_ID=MMETSP1437 /ASSEMBLY_ACC=CAM_ASM_001096 /LENGTH=121 /DNA_ID=CAMNT_0043427875 /DNA_START=92 /DNA_END=454 /DNA_ORIENTATION=-